MGVTVDITEKSAVLTCPTNYVIPTGFDGTASNFDSNGIYDFELSVDTFEFSSTNALILSVYPGTDTPEVISSNIINNSRDSAQYNAISMQFVCGNKKDHKGRAVKWTATGFST